MRVLLLPERKAATCRFYELLSSNDAKGFASKLADVVIDPSKRWQLPSNKGVVSPGEATGEMDSRLSQAAVFARSVAPAGEVNGFGLREFLFGSGNGALETDAQLNIINMQRAQFTPENKDGPDCVVIYVPKLNALLEELGYFDEDSGFIFLSVTDWTENPPAELTDPEDEEGASKLMDRVLGHEFGHFMGISTRNIDGEKHDDDRYHPPGAAALMRSGAVGKPGRWIRDEDWKRANERALERGLRGP